MKKGLFFTLLVVITTNSFAQNVGIGTTSPNAKLDVNGAIATREGTALTLANGANANVALTGNFGFYRITGPTASFSISGLTTGSDGKMVTLVNTTSQIMTIQNQTGSTSTNQINTLNSQDITLQSGGSITFHYNSAMSKWLVTGNHGADAPNTANLWNVKGNAGTNSGTNFIGTTDNVSLRLRTNNSQRMVVDSNGNVGIGTPAPTSVLDVNGATRIRTMNSGAATDSLVTSDASGNLNKRTVANVVSGATTHSIGLSANILTSTVNGVSDTAMAVSSVSNTSSANTLSTTVNGVTGSTVNIINTNATSLSGTNLTTTVNGFGATALDLTPAITATAWKLTGNSGTVDGTNFIGSTDNIPLSFKVNGQKAGRIDNTKSNVIFGYQAGNSMTSAANNTFVGHQAGLAVTSGTSNSAFGIGALKSDTGGANNNAFGSYALANNTSGATNAAFGVNTLYSNTTGSNNTSMGVYSSFSNTTGGNNSAYGYLSFYTNTTGSNNTTMGYQTLYNNTTGSGNLAIGYKAGFNNHTGSNNTLLGNNAITGDTLYNNATAIGANAQVDTSNCLVLGSINGTNTATASTNVGIGITKPTNALHVKATSNPVRLEGLQTGLAADTVLCISTTGVIRKYPSSVGGGGGSGWATTGSAGLNSGTNFLGTTDNVSLRIRTNNTARMVVDSVGNVGIGTAAPSQKLHIVGGDTTSSVIAATADVFGMFENNSNGSAAFDLKTTNSGPHTFISRFGINPSYQASGGNGVIAWYGAYDGVYSNIFQYDYINKNLLWVPPVAGYTINNVGINLSQASIGSRLTVNGGLGVSNGASSYSTTAAPAGGAIIEGNVGVATSSPNSNLEVAGSFAAAITTVSSNVTLDATYHTVIITGGTPTITLPAAAASNARRIYVIVNQTGASRTTSSYKNFSNAGTTSVASHASITIQSDGSNWYQIH